MTQSSRMHNSENKQKLGLFIFFNYYLFVCLFWIILGFVTQFGETTEASFLLNICHFVLHCPKNYHPSLQVHRVPCDHQDV